METGKIKLLRQMMEDGIEYIFGNPGTVEQGLLDELYQYPQIQYITCLHESAAVAMADGYARAKGLPAVIQLHSGVGLGNGIGMLYQAYRGHSPLIVIAGEAGIKYDAMDAQMACDLVKMAEPVTKYAARAVHPSSLLRLWRRAYKMAVTPPMGPVFLSIPLDILDMENEEEICATSPIDFQSAPEEKQIVQVANALAEAQNPVILAGDGVSEADGVKELERCAKLAAVPVYGVNSSYINISQLSLYYQGDLGHMFGENSKRAVQDADVVLIVGTYTFPEVFPELKSPFRPDAKIFHIDLNSYEIAKNHPVTMGICASPKIVLAKVNEQLANMSLPYKKQRETIFLHAKGEEKQDGTVIAAFMEELRKLTDENLVIFDEALTSSPYLAAYLPRTLEGTFFQTRGGSLGVGIPGGMGIQLALPEKQVLVFTGDGGSMYTIQALHAASRYHIPVKIVILNNKRYHLLDNNLEVYRKEQQIPQHRLPDCFSLEPVIDFVTLARSMGVDGVKVETRDQAAAAADMLVRADKPFLVDLNCG
jgi:benzoylformate decarboxylase